LGNVLGKKNRRLLACNDIYVISPLTTFCGNDFYQSAELSPLLPLLVLLYYYGVFFLIVVFVYNHMHV